MNAKNIFIVALIGLAAYFLFIKKGNSGTQKDKSADPGQAPKPEPAQASGPVSQKFYDVDGGEGLLAINARVRALENSSAQTPILRSVEGQIYAGLSYPHAMRKAMQASFGDAYAVPLYSTDIEPAFVDFVDSVLTLPDFNDTEKSIGLEKTLQSWYNSLQYGGNSYYPAGLKELVDSEQFGKPGKSDKNKSERYGQWASDTKKLFKNMQSAVKSYTSEIRNKAISDLRNSGWKFYGIDQ